MWKMTLIGLAMVGCASSGFHEGRTSLSKNEQSFLRGPRGTSKTFDRFWQAPNSRPWGLVQWDPDRSWAVPEAPKSLLRDIRDQLGRLNQRAGAIQKECGKKLVQRTSLAVTEGGGTSELSYVEGEMVHRSLGMSSTKTVATEERPFVEVDELKQLPNNVAVVLASNGDRTLPATVAYLRPLWVQKSHPEILVTTPWLDWPVSLRATYDLDSVPQEPSWQGWGMDEPLPEESVVPLEERLGRGIGISNGSFCARES